MLVNKFTLQISVVFSQSTLNSTIIVIYFYTGQVYLHFSSFGLSLASNVKRTKQEKGRNFRVHHGISECDSNSSLRSKNIDSQSQWPSILTWRPHFGHIDKGTGFLSSSSYLKIMADIIFIMGLSLINFYYKIDFCYIL